MKKSFITSRQGFQLGPTQIKPPPTHLFSIFLLKRLNVDCTCTSILNKAKKKKKKKKKEKKKKKKLHLQKIRVGRLLVRKHIFCLAVNFLNFRGENFNYLKFKQRGQTKRIFCPNDANGIANSEDPDQTAP